MWNPFRRLFEPIVCPECGKTFSGFDKRFNAELHIIIQHFWSPLEKRGIHTCWCGEPFRRSDWYSGGGSRRHLRKIGLNTDSLADHYMLAKLGSLNAQK